MIRQGPDAVRAILTGLDRYSRQLRSSSPFVGVLNDDVRLEAVRQATAAQPNPGTVSEVLRSLRIGGIEYDPVARSLAGRYLELAISRTELVPAIAVRRSYAIASFRLPVAHSSARSPLASIQP